MKKITLEMVRYWTGHNSDDANKALRDIANSHFEKWPWTPDILYNDIIESWNANSDKEG